MRILVTCRTCGEPLLRALAPIGETVTSPYRATRSLTEEELADAIKGVEIAIAGTDHFSARVIEAGSSDRLRMIARFGIGLDNIDLKSATENRILVTYAPKASSASVAEFTVGLILALLRRISESDSAVKAGAWPMGSMRGREINGKTVGIIGLGTVGKRVADVLRFMGANVIAYDPYVKDEQRLVTLAELLGSSDIITIHSALTPASKHLIGPSELSSMKRGALVVNTARGAIIDELALADALERGLVGGAALDVLETEPPPSPHPLAKFPNVILTPHIAGNTEEATERMSQTLVDDIKRFIRGEAPLYPANPDVVSGLGLKRAS